MGKHLITGFKKWIKASWCYPMDYDKEIQNRIKERQQKDYKDVLLKLKNSVKTKKELTY